MEGVVTLTGVWLMSESKRNQQELGAHSMILLTAATTGERESQTAVGGTNHQSNTAKWQGLLEPHVCTPSPNSNTIGEPDQWGPGLAVGDAP